MEYLNWFALGENGYEYPGIKGENYYCVPTCIAMVLSSMGIHYNVDELATRFSPVTSYETAIDNELGVHINCGDLDRLFDSLDVPLYEEYIPINQISEFNFSDLIHDLLLQKVHIICGYSFGSLFNEQNLLDLGHVSIILSSTVDGVHILNPGPKHVGINRVNEYDLYCAIRYKYDGLWVLKTKGLPKIEI